MKRYLLSFYLSNSFLKSYKYRKRDLIGPRSNRLTTVIAEISGSGDNDVARSTDLIDACIDAGADLIKVQTLIPEETAVESHIISHGLWEGHERTGKSQLTSAPIFANPRNSRR